ncbi:heme transporter hrg1-A-like [Argonauta hians]
MALVSRIVMNLRIFFSILGILFGISVVFVFGIKFRNWNTALWGLLSAIPASLTFSLHICYLKGVWQTYPYRLKYMVIAGCLFQLAGIVGFVTYLALGFYFQQGLQIYGDGYFLTAVWCFMTWKWGLLLLYFTRSYRQLLCDVYTILPTEAPPLNGDD